MKLVFATNNKHKLREVRQILGDQYEILSLEEIGFHEDIPETEPTIEGNASLKSYHIWNRFKINCFADDTGLEIEALNGEPGVYSARYAGEGCNFEDNINKVLKNLKDKTNRSASFRAIFSLIIDGKELQFEGKVPGIILAEKKGIDGFGYDPIFQPIGYELTYAEMSADLKNKLSHRGESARKMSDYLKSL